MTYFDRMRLIESLELLIKPNEENDDNDEETRNLRFTWDIKGYTEDFIFL